MSGLEIREGKDSNSAEMLDQRPGIGLSGKVSETPATQMLLPSFLGPRETRPPIVGGRLIAARQEALRCPPTGPPKVEEAGRTKLGFTASRALLLFAANLVRIRPPF